MKLFYSKGACSLAVRIIINELGLNSTYVAVDLSSKKTETGENYYAINPKGAVPAIMTDADHLLTENAVILQYLADTAKAYQLLPAVGEFKRYQVLEWLNYVATEMHKSCSLLFNPGFTPELKEQVIKPFINGKLKFLNKHFETNEYLAGDEFTLADAYLFVMLRWVIYVFKFDMTEFTHIKRYFDLVSQRASVVTSLQQEA